MDRPSGQKTGHWALWILAWSIPTLCGVGIFVVATQAFGLPKRAWAVIGAGVAVASYGFIWHGQRLAARTTAGPTRELPRSWWRLPLGSIGGVTLLAMGGWLLLFGDPTRSVVFLVAGVTLIVVAGLWRRRLLHRCHPKRPPPQP